MSAVETPKKSGLDLIKWLLALGIVIALIVGNHYYEDTIASAYRILAMLAGGGIALLIFLTTETGKRFAAFAREARIEIRKVVWPTRSQTVKTTLVVMVFTIVMALLLWAVDAILVVLIEWIMRL
ncbi:MAG: preprotein translocase subunit SecE [Gammaproteobacteria bacterium]|nr:MAG: preprotein translocase subunit SecE [Gammaproteobacteria bacterium]